jgi:hypothetical protein
MHKIAVSLLFFFFAGRPADIPFEKITLDLGANESATFADVNGDGRLDIISGENWFEAPRWTKHHFRDIYFDNNYIDDFGDLAVDFNGDGRTDVASCGWFSRELAWWRNPGHAGGPWQKETIKTGSSIEFCFLVDMDNDGKAREILPQFGNAKMPAAWYEYRNGKWEEHTVADKSFGHGIGAGDVNKDGRTDIITQYGWLEAPADPRTGNWVMHSFPKPLGNTGFIHVLDVNGDGRNDLLTSLAHDYGIFWLEQNADGTFTRHLIDESFSQAHAVVLADLTGDGKPELITGKRFMAHNGKDPGEREPLGVYYFESVPAAKGKGIQWVRHTLDYGTRAGGGMQVSVADFDKDGDLDFVVGGKAGTFLFVNKTK